MFHFQSYEKWLDSQGGLSPISNQPRKLLEQCRVKKKTIHSHEARVNKIKSKKEEVKNSALGKDDADLNTEAEQFCSKWDKIVLRSVKIRPRCLFSCATLFTL